MSARTLTLYPFASETAPEGVSITASVSRQSKGLAVKFSLDDPHSLVQIQSRSPNPARRDNLWQATCLEFFFSCPGSTAYWEFNLSPSGDWNVYQLNAYRQGLREEKVFVTLPFSVEASAKHCILDLKVDVSLLVHAEQAIELGVTAVIKTKRGDHSYWALTHCGAQPDFHLRESFVLSF